LYRDSVQGEPKIVLLQDPARSGLNGREHRKLASAQFAGRHGLDIDAI
jgi:hypothetical protein